MDAENRQGLLGRLILILTIVVALTPAFGITVAHASRYENPWEATAVVDAPVVFYREDGLTVRVMVWGATSPDIIRVSAVVSDCNGKSFTRSIRNLLVDGDDRPSGMYEAYIDFTPEEIGTLEPGEGSIDVDLEWYNDSIGAWMDCEQRLDPRSVSIWTREPEEPSRPDIPSEPETPSEPESPGQGYFYDMTDPNDWRYDAVYAVAADGLITGYPDGSFGVNDTLTTAQLITILWRYADPTGSASYDQSTAINTTYLIDAPNYQYYTGAVNWAVANGIVDGIPTPAGYKLDPDSPVATERAMTIIANYVTKGSQPMSEQEIDTLLARCTDGWTVSGWARPSMAWALKVGMISGYETAFGMRELKPQELIPRGRFAVILDNGLTSGTL